MPLGLYGGIHETFINIIIYETQLPAPKPLAWDHNSDTAFFDAAPFAEHGHRRGHMVPIGGS